MGIEVLFVLQKMGECTFSSKKGEVGKIVEEGFVKSNIFVANLCVYKCQKHYNPRYIQKQQDLNSIDPNF